MATPTTSPQEFFASAPDVFATLLAALAAPSDEADPMHDSSNSDLQEDVLALSDEHALRGHFSRDHPHPAMPHDLIEERKAASITIRVSRVEREQIKSRAEEAGLSVSAYLRSCALEAESLRAQVKQALATMRATVPEKQRTTSVAAAEAPRRWWQMWPPAQA